MINLSPAHEGSHLPLVTIACSWVFVALALVAVSVQVLACRLVRHKFDIGDALGFLAALLAIVLVAQVTWAVVVEGQGTHTNGMPLSQQAEIAKSLMANELLWGFVTTLIRLSDLDFLRAIFGSSKTIRRAIWLMVFFCVAHFVALILEPLLICRPIAAGWNIHINGFCGDQIVSYVVLETISLLVDLAIVGLPLPTIVNLKIALRRKLSILIVFSLSLIFTTVSGLRLHALRKVNDPDFVYSRGYLGLLSSLGALTGIVTSSATAFLSLFTWIRKRRKDERIPQAMHTFAWQRADRYMLSDVETKDCVQEPVDGESG